MVPRWCAEAARVPRFAAGTSHRRAATAAIAAIDGASGTATRPVTRFNHRRVYRYLAVFASLSEFLTISSISVQAHDLIKEKSAKGVQSRRMSHSFCDGLRSLHVTGFTILVEPVYRRVLQTLPSTAEFS